MVPTLFSLVLERQSSQLDWPPLTFSIVLREVACRFAYVCGSQEETRRRLPAVRRVNLGGEAVSDRRECPNKNQGL